MIPSRYDTATSGWRWVATAWPGTGGWKWGGSRIYKAMVSTDSHAQTGHTTRYRIHLPIYNGFETAAIGVPAGSTVAPDPPARILQAYA